MKILVVKMSSLGDVIHTLPAVTDAVNAFRESASELIVDWVVEEAFAEIPAMHPNVRRVIPVAMRRWRRDPIESRGEFARFLDELRQDQYDLVIDAQGLIKSAFVVMFTRGSAAGLDRLSAREPLASAFYRQRIDVAKGRHAIERVRELFSRALDYPLPETPADYGLASPDTLVRSDRILLLHGTTWASKHWPESYWRHLAVSIAEQGLTPVIPAGNEAEAARAKRIGQDLPAEILDRVPLSSLLDCMTSCRGAVAVDTGLAHLAAAANLPLVGIYGPTSPTLTGPAGPGQASLASDHLPCIPCFSRQCRLADDGSPYPPCFSPLDPTVVWERLRALMAVTA